MKILIIPNQLYQHIKTSNINTGSIKNITKVKVECIKCGFKIGELTICHIKCFKCGSELICSNKDNKIKLMWI